MNCCISDSRVLSICKSRPTRQINIYRKVYRDRPNDFLTFYDMGFCPLRVRPSEWALKRDIKVEF